MDSMCIPAARLMFANGKRIADFALKNRLPSMYDHREAVDAGGLMSYGADLRGQLPARRIFTWTKS